MCRLTLENPAAATWRPHAVSAYLATNRLEQASQLAAGHLKPAPLTARAARELLATGARHRRTAVSGPDALTAAERRVAELATGGLTNRQIAQRLLSSTHGAQLA